MCVVSLGFPLRCPDVQFHSDGSWLSETDGVSKACTAETLRRMCGKCWKLGVTWLDGDKVPADLTLTLPDQVIYHQKHQLVAAVLLHTNILF